MKICQVLASDEEGGLEKHFIELTNALAENHDIFAIASTRHKISLSPKVSFLSHNFSRGRRNFFSLVELYQLLRRINPDIIHAQGHKAAAMVASLHPFISAKYVATAHGLKKKNKAFRTFDAVIAVSYHVGSHLNLPTVEVVYNGIVPPVVPLNAGVEYLEKVLKQKIDGPVVAAVGRLVSVKGFDLLLEAWKNIPATLMIVGSGPERHNLEKISIDGGISERVIFLGERDDVAALLASVDLTVISSYREAFSYVFAESLHVGTPVVATSVPIASEVLAAPYLVPCGDSAALSRTVLTALENTSLKKEFASHFLFAQVNLTLAAQVEQTKKIYRKLLDEN